MLSLQRLELCPYNCIPWKSSRVLWSIIIFISFSKHKNSGLFFKKIWISSSYPSKHWNSPLSFQTLQFCSLFFSHWSFTLSLRTLEFWPYPSKHWHSGLILPNTEILVLSFQTLEFWPYPSKHWNSDLIFPNVGILFLSFQTLDFWPCRSKHWDSYLILPKLEFWPYAS